MQVLEYDIDRPKPYPGNPRINKRAVSKVAASIREFGFRQPIVVDENDVIIVGHTRHQAAMEAGLQTVPVHVAEGLTDEQKRAYRLADNRLNEYAKWDEELLTVELEALKDFGYDMQLTGFSETQLRRYTAVDLREQGKVETIQKRSQPGELWHLGDHRLMVGDCENEDDVAMLLQDDRPVLMVTDPPYGVRYDPQWRSDSGVTNARNASRTIKGDERADWRLAWQLFPGDVAYVWHGGLHAGVVAESLSAAGFQLRAQIVWVKPSPVISRGHYHWQHEPCWITERSTDCWYSVRQGRPSHWTGSRGETTVWEIGHDEKISHHPTQKPIECMARPMMNSSADGDYVYDPFVGSGTSIIAAERTGRRCLAMEIDTEFADVSIARWEAVTGLEARREG